ncbi:MAG TPA: N(4)-(beta-N-acetylglucosaminyl)-L-asparaginase [Phycisphaerae bacterium]|nr:N(4)-(beta-N-acetylglucosaminyl)-L-asparaginase [Phycisphaerae bacterium]
MSNRYSRRRFLKSTTALVAAGGLSRYASRAAQADTDTGRGQAGPDAAGAGESSAQGPGGPVVIASGNGQSATAKAMEMILAGADPLDAVVAGVNIVERDPQDMTVGYGGLPNEDGVVELDSCVMHGPTHNAGAVAGLRHIKTPSRVAKLVMERTDHVLIVGKGALRFAKAHGFKEEELLTDDARREWLKWKEARPDDDWIGPEVEPEDEPVSALAPIGRDILPGPGAMWVGAHGVHYTCGTINCCGLDASGNLAGVTTTSGLSYKIPGRVGDSPIIGAGLFVDNEIGAAGATGRGEAAILNCGSFSVVEAMRQGKTPTMACLDVLRRVVARNHDPRLKRSDGRPNFDLIFYAVRKDGLFGSAAIWSKGTFAVHAGRENRLEECASLFERPPKQD